MRKLLALGLTYAVLGCVAVPEVDSSDTSNSINAVSLTCSAPYKFTQDCNNWIGASKKISIDGFDIKVGATSDGHVVLVMDAKWFANSLVNPFVINSPAHSKASNNSFEAVRKTLIMNGVKINLVRPVKSFGNIDGYILELGSDGYSILKKYSVK